MQIVFWLCLFLIAYTYLIYPLLVIALARLLPARQIQPPGNLPTVTMVVPAYNEEDILDRKLDNCLALDYPAEQLDFLFGSDGSSDATNQILSGRESPRLRGVHFPQREGKTRVLNKLLPRAAGEILLLSDANSLYNQDAVRQLVRHFWDPDVGGVCGKLRLISSRDPGGEGEGLYWRFENLIKEAEGRLGTVISANGAIFAVRRELISPLPTTAALNDDFQFTLQILGAGRRVLYEPEAVAVELSSPDMKSEFRRKVRISSLNFNGMPSLLPLLNPLRGFSALALFSHKLLRWLVPFLGAGLLAANLGLLSRGGVYPALLIGQGGIYLGALLGFLGDVLFGRAGPLLPFYYLAMINLALVIGFWKSLTASQQPTWDRAPHQQRRVPPPEA